MEERVKYLHINEFSSSLGKNAQALGEFSVALGHRSRVANGAKGSVAIGNNAKVKKSAPNAVALGQNSVADEANTVSVGNKQLKRRITNVADGVKPYDAVNMRQFNRLDKKVNGVAAMSVAMSALTPNYRSNKNTQISLGIGSYKGETAVAVGAFHYFGKNILFNAALSHSKTSGTATRAGITWGF